MGASAVLRFADVLPNIYSTAIAINPEIHPWYDWRRPTFILACLLQPGVGTKLYEDIQLAVNGSSGRVHIHCSLWAAEKEQARLLNNLNVPQLVCINVQESNAMGCIRALLQVSDKRIVRLEHQQWYTHGMINKKLRPDGGLVAILEEALTTLP